MTALDTKALAETQIEFNHVPPGLIEEIIIAWNRRVSPSQGEGPAADVVEALRGAKVIIEMMERPTGLGAEVEAALDRRLAAINAILASLAPRAAQEALADEQSGETSHVAVSDAMVEAAQIELGHSGIYASARTVRAAITAALAAEPGEAVAATEITMGRGLVDVTCISHEGRSGILFHPRDRHIPVGEPGGLPAGTYWPVNGDVVIWIENEGGAQVIQKHVAKFLAHPLPLKEEVERVLEALITDILSYEKINALAPNSGKRYCWQSVENAVALLSRIRAGAREGWKLVPRTPTQEMMDAADRARPLPEAYIYEIWGEMLAAAPSPVAKGGPRP